MSRSGVDLCDDVRRSIFLVNSYLADHATGRQRSRRHEFDFKTRDAVIYRLIVIGEAAKFLLRNFSAKVATRSTAGYRLENVLRRAYGMRNRLVHQHWAVREQVVMTTAGNDLQPLGLVIDALKGDVEGQPEGGGRMNGPAVLGMQD